MTGMAGVRSIITKVAISYNSMSIFVNGIPRRVTGSRYADV